MAKIAGGMTLVLDKRGLKAVKNGVKQGAKDVVKSYTGSSKEENVLGKAASFGVGATKGYSDGKKQVKQTASQKSRLEGNQYMKSSAASKTVVKTSVKAGAKSLGVIGFVSDAVTFTKGFIKGVKNTYSKSGR